MTLRVPGMLLAAALLAGCNDKNTNTSVEPMVSMGDSKAAIASVETGPADNFPVSDAQLKALGITLQRLDRPIDIPGLVYPARVVVPPQHERVLSAPLAGLVEQILVAEHQSVKRGDPLLRMSSPEFGELQLSLLEAANRDQLARKTLERERMLFKDGIIPRRRVYEAELAASDSEARLGQSSAALRLAGLDAQGIERIAAGGVLMDALTLHARENGTVLALEVKPGQQVRDADPLLRIADLAELWLDIEIPVDRASGWSKEQTIIIVGSELTARALSVSAQVSESQTVTLRARIVAGNANLGPGEFVQARVPFANRAGAWAVPIAAVVREDGNPYVFVRTASGFAARQVNVVASAAQSVSVEGDLKPGDEIAVSSVIALKAAWLGESGGE